MYDEKRKEELKQILGCLDIKTRDTIRGILAEDEEAEEQKKPSILDEEWNLSEKYGILVKQTITGGLAADLSDMFLRDFMHAIAALPDMSRALKMVGNCCALQNLDDEEWSTIYAALDKARIE